MLNASMLNPAPYTLLLPGADETSGADPPDPPDPPTHMSFTWRSLNEYTTLAQIRGARARATNYSSIMVA